MSLLFRPALRQAVRAVPRTAAPTAARNLGTSAFLRSSAPPIVVGPGAQPGEVPTDENQSTGLERFELEQRLQGKEAFDMQPLQSDRVGTIANPIVVNSPVSRTHFRMCGCVPMTSISPAHSLTSSPLYNHLVPRTHHRVLGQPSGLSRHSVSLFAVLRRCLLAGVALTIAHTHCHPAQLHAARD